MWGEEAGGEGWGGEEAGRERKRVSSTPTFLLAARVARSSLAGLWVCCVGWNATVQNAESFIMDEIGEPHSG